MFSRTPESTCLRVLTKCDKCSLPILYLTDVHHCQLRCPFFRVLSHRFGALSIHLAHAAHNWGRRGMAEWTTIDSL